VRELELERDRFQPVSNEVDEEEEHEVVPKLRVDRAEVQEIPEAYRMRRSRPWNTCAEWPTISVAPPSSRVRAAARACATGSASVFGLPARCDEDCVRVEQSAEWSVAAITPSL
jgi:hypothetical protein